jgi:hypothetical protein
MLHPRLRDPAVLADLRATWQAERSLRIADFLAEDAAVALRDAVRACPHTLLMSPSDQLAFQYWVFTQVPDAACDHVICRAARWLWTDGVAWVAALTDLPLVPPEDRQLVATLYDKGSYLDCHNDWNDARQVAFILGLTTAAWPAEDGGWLEFYDTDPDGGHLVERRPPGWNTLDLFDVRGLDHPHAVPIVTRRAERRALSGWFY